MNSAELDMRINTPEVQRREKRGISGSTVKIIAVIAMLIDHTAAAVLLRQLLANGLGNIAGAGIAQQQQWVFDNAQLYSCYTIMRLVGRLGFPIFCFLLVEGYQRTRDVKKYAVRLGIFALISEIPFDLALCGNVFFPGYQNVYFTLLLGLLALWAYGFFAERERAESGKDLPGALRVFLTVTGVFAPAALVISMTNTYGIVRGRQEWTVCGILCVLTAVAMALYGRKRGLRRVQTVCADMTALAVFMLVAEILNTDYSGMGVLTITVMYLFRKHRVLAMLMGCVMLTVMSFSEITAFFALIPIALYNGKRGLKMKYFFYAFYPAHLFILYIVALLLGMGSIVLM